ncbi:MAG: LysR family transcriptional regulator [Oscillospiraceae bacterium]|nr:LysR family transcriptional regulator [Oscillospiraceae bacterium]
MNLQHLKYMTEVERTGSVTKAAANLFMGQPNLSKAIKEVENEIGITVFRRSAKGVYPTPEGERFLVRAKAVLEEMGKLEALYKQENAPGRFTICVPEAPYVPHLLGELARTLPDVNIECITAPFYLGLENVSGGICKAAAVRCPDECKDFFAALRTEKNIRSEQLYSGKYSLVFSEKSPLSEMENVTPEALSDYIRISSGDGSQSSRSEKSMTLRNGSDPYELLSQLSEAYMLAEALTEEKLRRYGLLQREISFGGSFTDFLMTPAGYKPDEYTEAFARCLKNVINKQ